MQAYLNDPKLKEALVAEIKKHQEVDQIVKGTYGTNNSGTFRSCAVSCSIHSLNRLHDEDSDHKIYEEELGIPEWLAKLEDSIFEGLPTEKAREWPLRFAEAIPVG